MKCIKIFFLCRSIWSILINIPCTMWKGYVLCSCWIKYFISIKHFKLFGSVIQIQIYNFYLYICAFVCLVSITQRVLKSPPMVVDLSSCPPFCTLSFVTGILIYIHFELLGLPKSDFWWLKKKKKDMFGLPYENVTK